MLKSPISRVALLSFFIVTAIAVPLLAGTNPVGRMNAAPTFVEWQISAEGEFVQLNVSAPDGSVWSRQFPAGRNPVYRLQEAGNKSMDGTYQYELVVVPRVSGAVKKELAAARAAGDDALAASIMAKYGLNQTVVQSGAFTILNGSILSPDLVEPEHGPGAAAASSNEASANPVSGGGLRDNGVMTTSRRPAKPLDQVIADDLIVQGSICVGLDCVVNESFGFDTIRLKENNDRIKFEDTSTSTGFPTTDWQLTANDSASGGANKFSIEDITGAKVPFTVTGGAATNSIFVDSSGRLGLRTSTPVLDIHATTGNTPALRFEQNSTGGFTAQTWDVAGNEANFFVRDVTGGSRLPFRIRPGAPTSSIDIAASGNVGVGSASPTSRLYVFDSTQTASRLTLAGQEFLGAGITANEGVAFLLGVNRANNRQLWIADSANTAVNGSNTVIRIFPNGADISALATNGAVKDLVLQSSGGNLGIGITPAFPIHHSSGARLEGGNWTNASSREFKQDINELASADALCALEQLRPVTYEYKTNPTDVQVGFIAEDVPALVATPDRKGLSPMDIVAVLTKVVQEQQKTIDRLNQRLSDLEKKN
jgi:hypothetical protein